MMLTDLADAIRAAGLTVVEEPGWQTRGHGPMQAVRTIVCHDTAGPATGECPSLGVVINGRPDLVGPLAQLVLGRSGTVYVVAAGCAWHAGAVLVPTTQANEWAIGIEAEADGVSPWPPVQYAAYVLLCWALCDHYGLSYDRVMGHKEVCSPTGRKIDPSPMDMVAFRRDVAAATGGPTVQWNDVVIPDYSKNPAVPLAADVTLGWMSLHAGQAAASAATAVTAANAVGTKVDALAAQVAALKVGGATVDIDALATAVADKLAARLAS